MDKCSTQRTKDISVVYASGKIKDEIKVGEDMLSPVNQQCVVYHFKCDLCDAGCVEFILV